MSDIRRNYTTDADNIQHGDFFYKKISNSKVKKERAVATAFGKNAYEIKPPLSRVQVDIIYTCFMERT
jgi:hypothetical protein